MLLRPISTDMPVRRTPWVNWALIAANVAVFLSPGGPGRAHHGLMLWAQDPRWYQFLTSMFLHANWGHLVGNMVFL